MSEPAPMDTPLNQDEAEILYPGAVQAFVDQFLELRYRCDETVWQFHVLNDKLHVKSVHNQFVNYIWNAGKWSFLAL